MNGQIWAATAIIVIGYMAGFFFQNRRIDDLRSSLEKRNDNLRSSIENRFDDLKDWIHSEIRRLEDRIERLEHPITRSH